MLDKSETSGRDSLLVPTVVKASTNRIKREFIFANFGAAEGISTFLAG